MITNVGLIIAIILFFILKFIYLFAILITIAVVVGKLKAKGQEQIKKWESGENGEKNN